MSDTHFDPPSFDGPGLDSAAENAWREFEARLARRLATLGDCEMVFITPSAEIANDRRFAIRAGRPGGVRVTVACPVDEPRRLVELGWRSTADGRLIREEPPSRADVIAGLVERTLREHWSMPAPAFLADTGRPHPDRCPIVAAEEMGPDAVRDLVKHDIETWFGGHLPLRADGTLQLPTGPVEASIGVSHEEPRIDVFARVATDMHPRFDHYSTGAPLHGESPRAAHDSSTACRPCGRRQAHIETPTSDPTGKATMTDNVHSQPRKKILYVDMDNTLVDFRSGIDKLSEAERKRFDGSLDEVPGIFSLMDPMPGAIAAYRELATLFDTYILSTAPWDNPMAWTEKLLWVKMHFGRDESSPAYKRVILSHHKNLNHGDFIIDDRTARGVDAFVGEHIHFGQAPFEDWEKVLEYLRGKA